MKHYNNYPNQPSLIYDLHLANVDYSSLDDVIKAIGIIELTHVKRIILKNALNDGISMCEDDFHIKREYKDTFVTYTLSYFFGEESHIDLHFNIDKINIRRRDNTSHYGLSAHIANPRFVEDIAKDDYLVRHNLIDTASGNDITFSVIRLDNSIDLFLYILSMLPKI